MIIIGYSGHAFVCCGVLHAAGNPVTAYCDVDEKSKNPFGLHFLGSEMTGEGLQAVMEQPFFVGVGDNHIRKKVFNHFAVLGRYAENAIHPSAIIDSSAKVANSGVLIAAGVVINPLARVGNATICNTGCIIEHECNVADFAHIGPGAVLCGNVTVGELSFIGAGAVIKQGVEIGKNVIVGAGAVVINNIDDNCVVVGNPAHILKTEKK